MISDISLAQVCTFALVFLHSAHIASYHYAVECFLEVYDIGEDFLVVFYALSSISLLQEELLIVLHPGLNPAFSSPSALSAYCFIPYYIILVKTYPGMPL